LKGYIPSVKANGALVDGGEEVTIQNTNLSLSVPCKHIFWSRGISLTLLSLKLVSRGRHGGQHQTLAALPPRHKPGIH